MLGVGIGLAALFGYWRMEGIQFRVPERRGGWMGKHGAILAGMEVCRWKKGGSCSFA